MASKKEIDRLRAKLLAEVEALENEACGEDEDPDEICEAAKGQLYAYENVRKVIHMILGPGSR